MTEEKENKKTPVPSKMMQHYLTIKQEYPDCVVFYRLGDFYELFFEDAVKMSSVLDLTLTGKQCGLDERAPMCGVPYHAVDIYLKKAVSAGYKVAVCEQLTEPSANSRELVERGVVKVVTAGTITDDNSIEAKKNNYLVAIYFDSDTYALSWVDITTGEFYTKTYKNSISEVIDELYRISPAEILADSKAYSKLSQKTVFLSGVFPKINAYRDSEFNYNIAYKVLTEHFKVKNLYSFNIEGSLSVCSSGALLTYLSETQMHAISNVNKIEVKKGDEFLELDLTAVKNLELISALRDGKRYGSLLYVLDKTKTSMGARLLTNWILYPLKDKEKIEERLNAVEVLFTDNKIREGLSEIFGEIRDVLRLTGKISNNNMTPVDCRALCNSLSMLPNLKFMLSGVKDSKISKLNAKISDFKSLHNYLDSAIEDKPPLIIKDGAYIKKGFSAELDELREIKSDSAKFIDEFQERERNSTGIKNLKVAYNRVFGYYIEVTNSYKEYVPYHYIRKQTLTGAERYYTEELKEFEDKILNATEKANALEKHLYDEVLSVLLKNVSSLKETAESIAELDVLLSFATVSKAYNYVKPEISTDGEISIKEGRHPVVEKLSKEDFVSNNALLNSGEDNFLIITGPNMAGKSTYMRQVALITLMAHIGCFVPAKYAKITLTDKIFTRIGASDNLVFDQSTFMVEMNEVASILRNATKDSLIILDEIGRGTSTYDGLSIAWSVVEYILNNIGAKTLFATHYHELTELEDRFSGVKNYKVTVKELSDSVVFLRKIVRGGANRSFGIEVAALAGVPKFVTDRAKEILKALEKRGVSKKVEKDTENTEKLTSVEKIIKDLNTDELTPLKAFNVLIDLKEKVDKL